MAIRAVQDRLNVFIEKPLSTSTGRIDELLLLIAQTQVQAAVAYTYRAHPALQSMRSAIRSGRFGRPVQVVSVWGQHFPTYRPAYHSIYYKDRETGGGAIQDVLPHAINAAEFLVGPIERIMADAAHQVLEGVMVEDTVHVIARHQGNILGCYTLNQHQAPNENTITVMCERGTARFELHQSRWLSCVEPGEEWVIQEQFSLERDDLFIRQANAALDMVAGIVPPLCTVEEGLQTLKVSLAILRGADAPRWHEV